MKQPYAKSKAVGGKNDVTVVAKSKDYSIYSQVLGGIKRGMNGGARITSAPFSGSRR